MAKEKIGRINNILKQAPTQRPRDPNLQPPASSDKMAVLLRALVGSRLRHESNFQKQKPAHDHVPVPYLRIRPLHYCTVRVLPRHSLILLLRRNLFVTKSEMTKPHGTAGGSAPDDSDLDGLLGSGNASSKHVPPASAFGASYADRHRTYYSTQPGGLGCCGYLTTCCWLTFQSSPKCGWILTFLAVAALAYGLVYCLDPTVQVGVVTHDWNRRIGVRSQGRGY